MSASRTAKYHMNLMSVIVFVSCLLLVGGNAVFAYPYLQLDANPATYVGAPEESIVTTDFKFTLYALINSEAPESDLTDTFYLAAAIVPDPGYSDPGPDLGSYYFDADYFVGDTYDIVGDMEYGTPPIEVYLESKDLPSHGIYNKTYYHEYSFTLNLANKATLYNSQVTQGGPVSSPTGTLYYQAFDVDVSGLNSEYVMHFDLYTYKWDEVKDTYVIDNFAPFTHDLTTIPVPGAVLLGMLGLGVAGLKLRKFA